MSSSAFLLLTATNRRTSRARKEQASEPRHPENSDQPLSACAEDSLDVGLPSLLPRLLLPLRILDVPVRSPKATDHRGVRGEPGRKRFDAAARNRVTRPLLA